MFTKVLVANRGEIAVRIIRTLRAMGISTVAVFSEPDRDALHVELADEAICIGPADATRSYLDIASVIAAAVASGAQAIHPGYGFLSENADLAQACAVAGVTFIGPSPSSITAMGDKIRAKATVSELGVATLPGFSEPDASDEALAEAATRLGFPLIVKPSAGGGGKGMRVVQEAGQLSSSLASARREARAAFGDDSLLLERFVEHARHVEVQIIADRYGSVVHAGDRDCSLQRRHQKVLEEAPAPALPDRARAQMHAASVRIAVAVGYEGVGTVEFVVDAKNPDDFFFLEMNTRLQVEHPVTEMVTGIDLVEAQVRIAAGETLSLRQQDIRVEGHAVEARVYAEDGNHDFLPGAGDVLRYAVPGDVRVDSGIRQGDSIGTNYDPLLFKVIAHGPDRSVALARIDAALAQCVLLGVANNIQVLRTLLGRDEIKAAAQTTGLIGELRLGKEPVHPAEPVWIAGALALDDALAGNGVLAWDIRDGWRLGASAARRRALTSDTGDSRAVEVIGGRGARRVRLDESGFEDAELLAAEAGSQYLVHGNRATRLTTVVHADSVWVSHRGSSFELRQAVAGELNGATGDRLSVDVVRSPMPGTVVLVGAAEGEVVSKGTVLVVVEAMKMEYPLVAPHDGVVMSMRAAVGMVVAKDAALAEVTPEVNVA